MKDFLPSWLTRPQDWVWFMPDGEHYCSGWFGTAWDEYGRKTAWTRVPLANGVLVVAYGYLTFDEVAEQFGDTTDFDRIMSTFGCFNEFAKCRVEDGVRL